MKRRNTTLVAKATLAFAAPLLIYVALASSAFAAPPRPPVSVSHYENTLNVNRLDRQGCNAGRSGKLNTVVMLHFGAPRRLASGVFGQKLHAGRIVSFGQILTQLKAYSRGYHRCWQTVRTGDIRIAWTTSNGNIPSAWLTIVESDGKSRAYHAGREFALAVRGYHQWLKSTGPNKASVYNKQFAVGGMDIEQDPRGGWSDWPVTREFVRGYASVADRRNFVNFGSNEIGDCAEPRSVCNTFGGNPTSWTVRGVTFVSKRVVGADGRRRNYACPQIYVSSFVDHWVRLQRASVNSGLGKVIFYCILTGSSGDPTNPFLTPTVAWRDFWDRLAANNLDPQNTVRRRVTFLPALSQEPN